jgi:hypothetical protein
MNDPLQQAEARLSRYWNVDGLHEIGMALIFALTALWVWADDLSTLPRSWKHAFSATFPIMLCGAIFVEGPIVKAIRRRLTYPRAGFADLRHPPRRKQVITAAAGALIAALLAAAAVRFPAADLRHWAVLLTGLGMGASLWMMGTKSDIPRFRVIGLLVAAAGLAIAASGATLAAGMATFFAIAAAALLTSGSITLWRFLHA